MLDRNPPQLLQLQQTRQTQQDECDIEDDIAPEYGQEEISMEMQAVSPLRQVYKKLASQSPKMVMTDLQSPPAKVMTVEVIDDPREA